MRLASVWAMAATVVFASPASAADEDPGEQVRMSLERYARLMAVAAQSAGGTVTWSRGDVSVEIGEDGQPARVSVNAKVRVIGDGPAQVVLLPADAVLLQADVGGSDTTLVRTAGAHVAIVEGGGEKAVSLSYLVPAATDDEGSPYAMVPLPPLPGASLEVSGAEGLSAWPSVGGRSGGSTISTSLPPTPAVLVKWGGAADGHQVRRIDYALSPDAGGDGVDVTATYEIRARGRRATVRLVEAHAALVEVSEGKSALASGVADGWHTATVDGKGRHVVTARYRLAIDRSQGQPQVSINPNQAPIARVEMTVSGKREVQFEPPVPVETVIRADSTRTVAHLPPSDQVTIRWTEARGQTESAVKFNTDTIQLLTLEEGGLNSKVVVNYDVIQGKLKTLRIALPPDVVLYKVEADGIEDWHVVKPDEEHPRHARVVLGRELEGDLRLELQLETKVKTADGTPLDLPVVRPLGAFRERGVVALFDGDKVGFAKADATGYATVGQDALPADIRQGLRDTVNQAYKHVNEPGPMKSKVATARTREVHFDARVDTLYLIRETALTVQASVLVEVKSGRADKVLVLVPKGEKEPRINAPSLNKKEKVADFAGDPERDAYEVRFTQPLEGAVQLDVEFERILKKDDDRLQLPEIIIYQADVQSGSFGIARETGMEVQADENEDLRKLQPAELPKAIRLRSDLEVVLGYQFAHAPWKLGLTIKRHRTVETLDAVAKRVWIETNVLESGHIVSRAVYEVANDAHDYVRLHLPEKAKVLAVAVDGRKVKAVRDQKGDIAIQLPNNRTLRVEVVFETTRDKLGFMGSIDLLAPKADLRTSNVQWLVRMPWETEVYSFDSEMTNAPRFEYRDAPPSSGAIELPKHGSMREILFTRAVDDTSDAAMSIGLSFTRKPGVGAGWLVFILALLALVFTTRRRAQQGGMDQKAWGTLALGVALLVFKALGWGLDGGEAVVAVVVIVAVGWASRDKPDPEPDEAAA